MVEAHENAVAVNTQRANDMRESAEIATGAKVAPTVHANPADEQGMSMPSSSGVAAPTAPSTGSVATVDASTSLPAPESASPAALSDLHVRLAIAVGLMVMLFILWVRQRHVQT